MQYGSAVNAGRARRIRGDYISAYTAIEWTIPPSLDDQFNQSAGSWCFYCREKTKGMNTTAHAWDRMTDTWMLFSIETARPVAFNRWSSWADQHFDLVADAVKAILFWFNFSQAQAQAQPRRTPPHPRGYTPISQDGSIAPLYILLWTTC